MKEWKGMEAQQQEDVAHLVCLLLEDGQRGQFIDELATGIFLRIEEMTRMSFKFQV